MNVKWCTPLQAEPTEEPRVKCNASIPTLANQLAPRLAAETTNELPELMTESDHAQQLGNENDATKSLNPYRPDNNLGDLDWRFSDNTGRFGGSLPFEILTCY